MGRLRTPTLAVSEKAALEQVLNDAKNDDVNKAKIVSGPHDIPDTELNMYAVELYDDFESVFSE